MLAKEKNKVEGYSLTEGKPWKKILIFALPMIGGSLLQQFYSTVDTLVVGNFARQGELALSAVGTTGGLIFLFWTLANGFASGVGVLISQFFGAGDHEKMRKYASTGIIMLTVLGAATTAGAYLSCDFLLRTVLGVPEGEILDMALLYYRIFAAGLVFQFIFCIVDSLMRAVGDSRASLCFLIISACTNIVLDLWFVAGLHWDVTGAAVATLIAQILALLFALFYMNRKYPLFRFRMSELKFSFNAAGRIVKIGLPLMVQQLVSAFGLMVIQRAVNSYGPSMMASFTVAQRIEMYAIIPMNCLLTGMVTFAGQNLGARKADRIKTGMHQMIALSLGITAVITVLLVLGTTPVIESFGIGGEAAFYCRQHIQVESYSLLILALYYPLIGMFQGIGRPGVGMAASLTGLVARILTTYFLGTEATFGYTIIWWGQVFNFIIGFILVWAIYLKKRNILDSFEGEVSGEGMLSD